MHHQDRFEGTNSKSAVMTAEGKIALRGNLLTGDEIKKGYILVSGGVISETGDGYPSEEVIDLGESYIIPGLIDLHTHGIHNFRIDNGPDHLKEMCRILPQYGVTGFLATVTPHPREQEITFLKDLAVAETEGAEILGFHLEGPFLKLTGALKTGTIGGSELPRAESMIDAVKPYRAIFSVSPDVEGIGRLMPLLSMNKTPVFMTHTAATVEQTEAAIKAGARHATHFYDVFPCPPVKEPGERPCGAVEAILADNRVSVDFILDGVHVDPIAVKVALACKSKGEGCVCLITDSNMGAGLEPGKYVMWNGREIEFEYKGGPARLTENHALSGSGLTMDQALRNAMRWLDISLQDAVKMVSTNPAKVIGLEKKKGKIEPGYDADFVILDKELNVLQTWINGRCFFSK